MTALRCQVAVQPATDRRELFHLSTQLIRTEDELFSFVRECVQLYYSHIHPTQSPTNQKG